MELDSGECLPFVREDPGIPRRGSCGGVAQLVEQRTENPCVGGSIPPPATILFYSYWLP